MLLPASQEFIALCQSQVKVLLSGLQPTEVAVYMTEQLEITGDASLKPLVVFPEVSQTWPQQIQWQLGQAPKSISPLILEPASLPSDSPTDVLGQWDADSDPFAKEIQAPQKSNRQVIWMPNGFSSFFHSVTIMQFWVF
ncbi:MAG: hypothetical protein HC810_05565 [Acaryochloridaceae cyanobacterium RL_2_7]|nr:hypothetical protein [Acaryochloridaceae cyanobacterium RL_2_7]